MKECSKKDYYVVYVGGGGGGGRHGCDCDRMVVGFTTTYATMQSVPIITNIVSSNPDQAIQNYVVKFVSDLWQVCGFLQALGFLHQ